MTGELGVSLASGGITGNDFMELNVTSEAAFATGTAALQSKIAKTVEQWNKTKSAD